MSEFGSISQDRGHWAEDLAKKYLMSAGTKFVLQNYRCRRGEIDIIVSDNDTLVFVEVRYRSQDTHGSALESIDKKKQRKIIATANHYLQSNKPGKDLACRFDAVVISGEQGSHCIEWVRDAFDATF